MPWIAAQKRFHSGIDCAAPPEFFAAKPSRPEGFHVACDGRLISEQSGGELHDCDESPPRALVRRVDDGYVIWSYTPRRKFRSQTSDNTDIWKSRGGKSQRREEKKRREEEKVREEKEPEERRCRRDSRCFSVICGSGGCNSRIAKAAGAEPAGRMRDEQLHAIVA